ncbi:Hvo_1808 family surface protein [Natrinema halophilum]|uniref:PGF-CTERM sorting domain-containing protein n=1 Tax=Natrinema halophilum TaxID=1699371 RepID=A0A7D5KEX4_9EURY|nr:Hvo_1808 family surface protein [Natrinema halophilum]QLG50596.1 Hvo_1808 family surface protein [Natrinema halophilum]
MQSTHPRSSVALFSAVLAAVLITGGLAGPALATTAAATPTGSAMESVDMTADAGSTATGTSELTAATAIDTGSGTGPAADQARTDRPENPTTEDTVGYVAGYWYDDELPVDDQSDAVVAEDELAPVVYRSMARVERIRNLTFEDEVSVDVVTRAEYRRTTGDRLANLTAAERLEQNVGYEALFTVDRNTAATDATESMYGGAVAGYYDPETDEIVIVSENPETPELDELTLGHELVHALQDQRFNLSRLHGSTQDEDLATDGLVEGDAKRVELEYKSRCRFDWSCLSPSSENGNLPADINWGIYFTIYQPYSDGPDYVNYLRDQDRGWSAVNAAYDDPPTTTSAVIHPGSEREPANVSVPDRSSGDWRQLTVDGQVAADTVGETGMVAMFVADAFESSRQPVIEQGDFLDGGSQGYDYDHSVTNGWIADRLVVYTNDDAANASTPSAAGQAGYVWRSEWQSAADAQEFVDGYLQLLESHGAKASDDRQDTFLIDDGGYGGAYYVELNGSTATIIRAPSADELSTVEAGAAPSGDDSLEFPADDDSDESDTIPGFGPSVAIGALVLFLFGSRSRIVPNQGRFRSGPHGRNDNRD